MKTLYTNNNDLTREKKVTFLTEDIVAGGTTMRVQNILGFVQLSTSSGQIVCLGNIGDELTEIKVTSNATSPSAAYKEITFNSAIANDHAQDTKVTLIDFNRVDTQWSASVTGSKSTIQAYPQQIDPTQTETILNETTQTTGYYFQRFNETVGNTNSDWSDAIPYSGYSDNMVASIKKRALDELGEEIGGKITHEFLNQCLWQARREYHQSPGKRPFRRKFNMVLGTALTGSYRIELPTDVENPYSAENIYGVRIGAEANMSYYDKKDFDFDYRNIPHTFLTTAYGTGDQDLYVSSTRDLADSGSVSVEGTQIAYSAKSISGGTLRISTAGSWACSVGSDVWQNASYGLPDRFTVFASPEGSAYIYFNRPIATAYVNQNIYGDYYRTLVGYDSDADSLDEPQYDLFVNYLKARIKNLKTKGESDITKDGDFLLFQQQKKDALATEFLGTDINISPNINLWEPL